MTTIGKIVHLLKRQLPTCFEWVITLIRKYLFRLIFRILVSTVVIGGLLGGPVILLVLMD